MCCLFVFINCLIAVKGTPTVPVGVMSAVDAYHCAAIVCTQVLYSLVARGHTYYAVEWILFQAHSSLLQLALEAEKKNKPIDQILVTSRCDNLSALIKNSSIPPGKQVLELQEKVSMCLTIATLWRAKNHRVVLITLSSDVSASSIATTVKQ